MLDVKLVLKTFDLSAPLNQRNTVRGSVDFDSMADLRSHLQNGSWIEVVHFDGEGAVSVRCSEVCQAAELLGVPGGPAEHAKALRDRNTCRPRQTIRGRTTG